MQAWTDNDTATASLQYTGTNGLVQAQGAAVEHGGNVWVFNVPLAAGTNHFVLAVANFAGNGCSTNFSVIQGSADWMVTPLTQNDLKYGYANVHGTIADPNATVTVNAVQATNDGYGNWEADYVPLPPGGTVALQATAHLAGGEILQTLLTYVRDPIVFTRAYGYKLDYTEPYWAWGKTNNWETYHFETQWARGVGGTDLETYFAYSPITEESWSNAVVTVWPPDNGYWPFLPGQQVMINYYNGVAYAISTNTVGPPPLEWMEQSAAAGSVAAWPGALTYAEASGRKVGLFTGGQGSRGSQNLLGLSASLIAEGDVDPATELWPNDYPPYQDFSPFLPEASPETCLPSEQISLDPLGFEDSDGILWTLLPCGIETGDTPRAPVTSSTGPLPGVQQANLQILANGNQLDPATVVSNAQFCVGQNVSFALSGLPVGATPTNFRWTLDGTYFNARSNAVPGVPFPTCSSVPYVDSSLLTSNATTAWWISGGFSPPTTYSVHVDVALVLTNGQTGHLPLVGQFTMARPRASITATTSTVTVNSTLGDPELSFGTMNAPGILFSNTISMPDGFSGSTEWVQVVNETVHTKLRASDGKWMRYAGRSELDTQYPYPSASPDGSTTKDTPGGHLEYGFLEYNVVTSSYTMWLLFMPAPSGSHWVPLRAVSWNWGGSAANGTAGWALESGSATNSVNPVDSDAQTYPWWTDNITNTLWTTQ